MMNYSSGKICYLSIKVESPDGVKSIIMYPYASFVASRYTFLSYFPNLICVPKILIIFLSLLFLNKIR